jgi:phosphatidylethanolamine-binding protein (PEBP) family uncharacterized protein
MPVCTRSRPLHGDALPRVVRDVAPSMTWPPSTFAFRSSQMSARAASLAQRGRRVLALIASKRERDIVIDSLSATHSVVSVSAKAPPHVLIMIPRRLMMSLVTALALAGCGSAHPSNTDTASDPATTTVEESPAASRANSAGSDMSLSSPALQSGRRLANGERMISVHYTCDGRNISPGMSWSGVPKNAAELVVMILDFTASKKKREFAWAVAGISPTTDHLAAGSAPPGAVVGLNGFGQARYSVCPPHGRQDTYIVYVYALPPADRVSAKAAFDSNELYERIGGADLPQAESGFTYRRL